MTITDEERDLALTGTIAIRAHELLIKEPSNQQLKKVADDARYILAAAALMAKK